MDKQGGQRPDAGLNRAGQQRCGDGPTVEQIGFSAARNLGDVPIDEDRLDGVDNDGDGRVDEDFAAIGQQMFSCMYKDDTPEAVSQISDQPSENNHASTRVRSRAPRP